MADLVAAIDQGTTSTRCIVVDHAGAVVASHQVEHRQLLPRPGWVEHDPVEIWQRTAHVVEVALTGAGLVAADLAAVGVANQRETTVVWNRTTGRPYHNAIVWQDTRTAGVVAALERDGHGALIRERAGLPPATYFAAGKLRWMLDNLDGLRAAAERGEAVFGTIDTWLLWHLSGGAHVTDVTNASRTMLMDLRTLDWDDELLAVFDLPRQMLPSICSSSSPDPYGSTAVGGPFGAEIPLTAALGDQHAALVGQVCFGAGEAKSTYGTGSFVLLNTGTEIVRSHRGLLTTVAYRFGDQPASYALEGSIAFAGAAVQWLRDQLGIIESAGDVEALASQVPDSGGVCFVPAFAGLFAPQWRPDARGVIVGLTRSATKAHLARATLEAIAHQTCDVAAAMEGDAALPLRGLKVDGGVTANELCMQLQADLLGVPLSRPAVAETTALGAAYAAGLATGFWSGPDELRAAWHEARRWTPACSAAERARMRARWAKAVERTLGWEELGDPGGAEPPR